MKVRAKFVCYGINHLHQSDPNAVCATITLQPVYGDGSDNAQWSKWTPQGKIEMMITNPAAIEGFELGKSYFVDFTPAE